MAKEVWLPAQEFPLGLTTAPAIAVKDVTPPLNGVDITLVPGADWLTVSGRTITFTVEQSLDGGVTWQHWVSTGAVPTGSLPRTGSISMGLSCSTVVPRKVRARVDVTGAPVTCGLEVEFSTMAM